MFNWLSLLGSMVGGMGGGGSQQSGQPQSWGAPNTQGQTPGAPQMAGPPAPLGPEQYFDAQPKTTGLAGTDAQAAMLSPDVGVEKPNFDQFGQPVPPMGGPGVLPPLQSVMNTGPQVTPSMLGGQQPQSQQVPGFGSLLGGAQPPQMPPGQGQPQGQPQQPGGMFDMTGTLEDPNIFLKLAEGYNRGGLLGSLGMGLTKF